MLIEAQEHAALQAMGGPGPTFYISDDNLQRVKVCDLIEMHEFGKMEEKLGNAFAQPIIRDTLAAVHKLLFNVSAEDMRKVNTYLMGI